MSDDKAKREREAADARALFSDDELAQGLGSTPETKWTPSGGGEYDFDDTGFEPTTKPSAAPIPPVVPKRPAKPKAMREERASDSEPEEGEAEVDEVWTRWGEWKPAVFRLAIVGLAVVFLAFFLVGGWTGFLIFLLGLVCLVLLSYPIAITLERPVRMTPEQAINDFYAAASHHFPHYRRMWLILSSSGRHSPQFDSFATFQSYWKHEMTKLRGPNVKAWAPLSFRIKEFDSDKSAGKTTADAKYVLTVTARGDDSTVLLESKVSASLVRGPDKMWYLNRGTLPAGRSA